VNAEDTPVGGPSYPRSYRVAATLVVLGLLAGAWAARGALLQLEWSPDALLMLAGGVLVVASGYGHLLRSRTVLRGDTIEHGWLWVERIAWRDVTQVHLLHWPALAWLIAPRLVLRAQGIGRRRVPLADARALARVRARLNG
jgi:hypothetical protein